MPLTMFLFESNQLGVLIIPSILRLLTPSVPVALPPLIIRLCLPAKSDIIERLDPLIVQRHINTFALFLELKALVVHPVISRTRFEKNAPNSILQIETDTSSTKNAQRLTSLPKPYFL